MKLCLSFLVLVLFAACNSSDKKAGATGEDRFVNPPIAGVVKPFENYKVQAERGDTLYHHSGSMLLFQPNAFLDKQGKVVTGMVDIKYREFNSPIDFYLNGISMNYDSSGTGYTLESSGMCEILAFQNGEPVFVNPVSKPEIILSSSTDAPGHNIYYLDTVKRNWVYEEPSEVVAVNSTATNTSTATAAIAQPPVPPVMPGKVEGDRPVIKIVIDTASFKELMAYDNLKFQIDEKEKNFKEADANEEWNDVELQREGSKGLYKIKFTNAKRTVTYSARPVLEGADYSKALKQFEKNNARYKKDMAARLEQQDRDKQQYLRDTLRNLRMAEENARIARLNLLAEAHNRKVDSLDSAIVREQRERKLMKEAVEDNARLYRGFSITRFGIYNCDRALQPDYLPITVNFLDGSGQPLQVSNVAVVYSDINSLVQFGDNKIRLKKNGEVMIFGKVDGRFAYVDYDAFRTADKSEGSTSINLPVKVVEEKDNNYEYIAAIASGRS